MLNVILGAILGGAVGLGLGWLPSYDFIWQIQHPNGHSILHLHKILHPLSMMIGFATGAIVGAIAGRVTADPNTVPLPRWVYLVILCVLGGLILLVVAGAAVYYFMDSPAPRAPGPPVGPPQQLPAEKLPQTKPAVNPMPEAAPNPQQK